MDRFDILAKVPPGTTKSQFQTMLQRLLAERFGMTIHREMKVMPVYALTVGKGQHKLEVSDGTDEPSFKELLPDFKHLSTLRRPIVRHVIFHNMTMGDFADRLSQIATGYFDRKITDDTRIVGAYDFTLKWSSVYEVEKSGGESIFDAVEKQLGLKLEARKASVEMLVIDKVLRTPIDN